MYTNTRAAESARSGREKRVAFFSIKRRAVQGARGGVHRYGGNSVRTALRIRRARPRAYFRICDLGADQRLG